MHRSPDSSTPTFSRRSFLAGAATTVAGIAASASLAGCGAEGTPVAETGTDPATTGESVLLGDQLNPQAAVEGPSGDMSAIFSPLNIAHVTVKNRLGKSCAGSELQESTEWPDEKMLGFYEGFCEGGLGMIVYEQSLLFPPAASMDTSALPPMDGSMGDLPPMDGSMGDLPPMDGAMGDLPPMGDAGAEGSSSMEDVMPSGLSGFLSIYDDAGIPAHQEIADRIHRHDVVLIAQMLDVSTSTGAAASTVREEGSLEMAMVPPLMQTTEQVQAEQQAFIDAAERYKKAGWDGVELNASCNHYFSTFLSRYANTERTDQYSGESIENRARILTEIIEGIRERVGDDFIIQVLYSGIEGNVASLGDDTGCTSIEEAIEFAKLFERAGASSLHVRSQLYGHHNGGFQPDVLHYHEHGDTGYGTVIDYDRHFGGVIDGSHDGAGALIEVAARIKEAVSIPVGTVGYMDPRAEPDLMNRAIADGKIDFMLMTRPLIADAAIAQKLEEGRRDEVAPCTRCMTCFVAPFSFGTPSYCRVNAAHTRAFTEEMPEGYTPVPASDPRSIMVIGGGPAGMEAARIAALRGHRVSLYEREDHLGGLTGLAAAVKGSHERIADHIAYLSRQLEVTGVDVHLSTEADVDLVVSCAPDIVVVACGGALDRNEPIGAAARLVTLADLQEAQLSGDEAVAELLAGERATVYGCEMEACNVAEYLVRAGRTVDIVSPSPAESLYQGAPTWPKLMGTTWLKTHGVRLHHQARNISVGEGDITFTDERGVAATVPFDVLVDARPPQSRPELLASIREAGFAAHAVGDAYAPGTIANAVARANIVARNIETLDGFGALQLEDDQYGATATGIGEVTVVLTVQDGVIAAADVDTSNETAGIGRELGSQFASQIVETGNVDAVSGATETSTAVAEALAGCKQQAGI
ncbi:FMN-binding protein [Adlercreutzia sp. R25]|uniref:oxidoreductase n=1 Tax=Adlercreutzia shanghongiae TaxID=3111773 RepID=UPI002DBD8C87|nr:FMN-binding protein [Adlercreutzia sp. R25]MEC4271601.1 FMN-binding protein [Adlercreutzia sp. R25]